VTYDEQLVARVRERLRATDGVVELNMFGGCGVTVHGNMAMGVMDEDLIVRVGPHRFEDALARPGVRPFDFTGRPRPCATPYGDRSSEHKASSHRVEHRGGHS
jgi:TfoX/Sxy family transcriptional regulator of competence genes